MLGRAQRYEFLVEGLDDTAVLWCSPDGQLEFINPYGRRVLGLNSGTTQRITDWHALVHPSQHEAVQELLVAAQRGVERFDIDLRLAHLELRTHRWFRCRARWQAPEADEPGSRGHWVAALSDISDRKQTEHLLRLTSEQLKQAVRSSPVSLFHQDINLRYTWVENPQYDWTLWELLGRRDVDLLESPEELRVLMGAKNEVLTTGEPLRREFTVTRGTNVRHFDTSLSPLRDVEGAVCGISGVSYDITDRRRAEAALRETDRTRNEFVAILAHELRNPIGPIRNMLALLGASSDDKTMRERAVTLIDRQVRHMVRLIDDLLDLTRLNTARLQIRKRPLDLNVALRNMAHVAELVMQERDIDFELDLTSQPLMVDADSARLAQVFGNLTHNARKFTPGRGRVRISSALEGTQAVVRVEDTGIGIAPEYLERVFEMFGQVPDAQATEPGGLGLGLYLARRITELHGGSIEATSRGVGQGCVFTVRLPLIGQEAASDTRPATGKTPSRSRRILVVDDNIDAADSLTLLLQTWGHEVRCAYDGQAGLDAACDMKPDLVLLDLAMPRIDGFELARRLRAQPGGYAVGLIAMSGLGREVDRQRGQDAGLDAHLVKPVDPRHLRQVIDAWEGRTTAQGGALDAAPALADSAAQAQRL